MDAATSPIVRHAASASGPEPSTPSSTSVGIAAATSPTASPAPSDTPSASPSESATTPSGDPTSSPIINKAVKPAMKDGFPALVPSGVPAGGTREDAAHSAGPRRAWEGTLTDAEIEAAVVSATPQAAGEDLLQTVLARGGTDNVTIVLVKIGDGRNGQSLRPDLSRAEG